MDKLSHSVVIITVAANIFLSMHLNIPGSGNSKANFYLAPKKDSLPQTNQKNSSESEAEIAVKILSIKEVKAKDRYIDSISHHKNSISLIFMGRPDEDHKYYWIQAGYNSQVRFEPYYNFYVNRYDLSVFVYDSVKERTYTLKEWQRVNKK